MSSRLANCTTAYRLFDSTVECTSNEKVKLVEDKYCLGVAIGSEAIIQFGIESYYRIDSSDSKNRSCHAYKSIIQSSDRSLWKYFNMDSKDSIYNSDKATYSAHSVKVYSIFSVVQMQDMLLVLGLDAQVVRIFCMPDIASFAITMYQSDLQKTTVPYMAITLWSLELFVLNIESDDWSNTSITQLFPLDVPRMLSIIPVMENDEENQTEENTREAVALPTKCIAVVAVASHSCMKAFACISTDGKLSLALLASYSFLQIYSVSDLINDSSKSGIILSSNSRSHLLYIWRNKLILEDFFLGKVISSKQTILTSGRNQTLIWVDQHIDRNSNLTSMSLNSIGVNSIFDTLEQHKKSTHIINRNYLEGRIHSIYEFGRSNFIVHLVTSRANHEEILVLKHDFSVALRMVLADSNSRSRKNSSTNRKIIRILTTISNNVSSNIDKLSHSFTMISVADNLPNLNAIDITILYYDEHKNSLRPISTAKLAYSDTNDNGILLSKTNNNENLIVYTPDNYLHVLTWKATSSPEPSSLVVSLNVILKYSLDEKLKVSGQLLILTKEKID